MFFALPRHRSDSANIWQEIDRLKDNRSLIYTGKFLQKSRTWFGWNRWTEIYALLFDNYRRGPIP